MIMDIVFEDNHILVVNKPAGIPSQTAKITEKDMVSEVNNYLNSRAGTKSCPVFLIHRLDRNVAGLLVFAKTKQSAAELNKQIQNGKIHKRYYALVSGTLKEESGRLENYLLKDGKSNMAKISDKNNREAKLATLEYSPADVKKAAAYFPDEYFENDRVKEGYSVVDINLLTGRFHQIRCQLSNIGNPIVGDVKYGGKDWKERNRIGLVAYSLELLHPVTKKPIKF